MSVTAADASNAGAPAPEATAKKPERREPGKDQQLWLDGKFIPADQAHTSLTAHGLHYGTGVFEGIRSYATDEGGAAVFRLAEHMERMARGAEVLGLKFDPQQTFDAIVETLRINKQREAYVRPLTWYSGGGLGLDVGHLDSSTMVATMPWSSHLAGHAVRLTVSPWRRIPSASVPALKLAGNYVNSIIAKREASARGFGEALLVDAERNVVECTGENVFMVKNGKITAVEHKDALPGITRRTIIELTGASARYVGVDELFDADEVFLTGTSAEVVAVQVLDNKIFGDNPITRDLQACYERIIRGRDPDYRHWLTYI